MENYKMMTDFVYSKLKINDFKSIREKLVYDASLNSFMWHKFSAILECSEMNFNKSLEHFAECMKDTMHQSDILFEVAMLNIQLGNFDEGEYMLRTLQLNESFYVRATFELVNLYFRKFDFYKAYDLLNSIPYEALSPNQQANYRIILLYIRYYLGYIDMNEANSLTASRYTSKKLIDHSDDLIIDHITKKHATGDKDNTLSVDINLSELLCEIRMRIKDLNPIYSSFSDKYRLNMHRNIGFIKGEETSDICVTTVMGTRDIITMYPGRWSDKFNIEGNLESKELRLKRYKGVLKK